MKVIVTGANGQLGHDVVKELQNRRHVVLAYGHSEMDICDIASVEALFYREMPGAVIHCAAYTNVDKAEDEVENCMRINALGSENVAKACEAVDAKLVYISTDYVFSGAGEGPWKTDDTPAPLNVYGKSKLMGENAVLRYASKHFIVRTSWVFGVAGMNFVKTMLRLGAEREELRVVSDQIGAPTYTVDLARLLADLIETEKYGVYHATNRGACSWAEFASAIMEKAKLKAAVIPITTEEYPARARRPKNSRLSKRSLTENGFELLPHWEDALDRFLIETGVINGQD